GHPESVVKLKALSNPEFFFSGGGIKWSLPGDTKDTEVFVSRTRTPRNSSCSARGSSAPRVSGPLLQNFPLFSTKRGYLPCSAPRRAVAQCLERSRKWLLRSNIPGANTFGCAPSNK